MRNVFAVQFKRSIRILLSNIKQFLSIIFIIGIAVTLFVGLQANYNSLDLRVNDMYERGKMASIWANYTFVTEDLKDKEEIRNLLKYDVEVSERLMLSGKIESSTSQIALSDNYPTISKPSSLYKKSTDGKNTYIETTIPFENASNFFIVDKTTARNYETQSGKTIDIGSELKITTDISSYSGIFVELLKGSYEKLQEKDPNKVIFIDKMLEDLLVSVDSFFKKNQEITISAKVTAFMTHPENIASTSSDTPINLLSKATFFNSFYDILYEHLKESYPDLEKTNFNDLTFLIPSFNNQYLFRIEDKAKIPEAIDVIREYYNNKEYGDNSVVGKLIFLTDISTLPSNISIQNDISQAAALSYVFPIVFLVVAILIVITTITQLILKDRTQIGTLKAIGCSNAEIYFGYASITLSLGFIGSLIGCLLGPAILPYIMNIKYALLYALDPIYYYFPWLIAFAVTFGILLLIAGITYLIIKKQLKAMPTECMKPVSPNIQSRSLKPKTKVMKYTSLKIAVRNMRVYFTKSIMVIIGVMGCTALLVCGFGIDDTINFGIEHDLERYYSADIMVTYTASTSSPRQDILDAPEIGDKIEKFYDVGYLPCTMRSETSGVYNNTLFLAEQKVFEEKVLTADFPINTVAIPQDKAEVLNIKENDYIYISILGKDYKKQVSLIYDTFSMHSIFVHAEDTIEPLTDFLDYRTSGYVFLKDEYKNNYEEVTTAISEINGISAAISNVGMRNKIAGYVSGVTTMTLAVKIFAILLAIICLANLALLNFTERTREIATLKVLGFSNPEIARSLIYETLFLTIVGTALGLALGLPMEYLVLSVNENALVSFIYFIGIPTYVISSIISIGTALCVNLALSMSIRKIKMVESLKSVE